MMTLIAAAAVAAAQPAAVPAAAPMQHPSAMKMDEHAKMEKDCCCKDMAKKDEGHSEHKDHAG